MIDKYQRKPYKLTRLNNISNLRIVSMIPGDLRVAGCFNYSIVFREGDNGRYFNFC